MVTAAFVTDHIDCLPLGDINATVVSLVQCNPDIDFVFARRIDDREFEMDTRVFREVLEGPLNTPEVIALYRRISGRTNTNDPRRKEGSVDEKLS